MKNFKIYYESSLFSSIEKKGGNLQWMNQNVQGTFEELLNIMRKIWKEDLKAVGHYFTQSG